ncbi:MAG: ATP-dependent sacrificial sulfur transferase LarE [Phycisphaerales bacterium]|nr:ATP-dependent sacrificial sulfur transferase LarE [Phycisphaerales bacterium]MCB9857297.1 ATP-dependent sacrificial sulfur transferase LarE [Phycisphaerales bacterium]MCB9862989.1 ATP-dependent sacrificial sulfur transferase LarE [Phycisphaerales bacterium]
MDKASPTAVSKLDAMKAVLRELKRVAVAFSGGVDSTFVLKVAVDALGAENVVAVTGTSDSLASRELTEAKALADSFGVRHVLVDPREFDDPNYLANPTNRCYYCKTALYDKMAGILAAHQLNAAINGTNVDDLGDHRPGIAAGKEHGVHSPCVDAGLTKQDIRELSAAMGLPTHDKPAAPCLSSRVQYGEEITALKLRMIERAENLLRDMGFRECRVRHHNNLARIEVPANEIGRLADADTRATIDAAFREFGYSYVTLDLRGFRSGSLNEVIAFGKRQTIG